MKLFDSHCHLNDEKFNDDREEVIKACLYENNCKFVINGYSLETSKEAIELAKKYDVYATVGISPNDIPQTEEELWKQLANEKQIIETEIKSKQITDFNGFQSLLMQKAVSKAG